MHGTQVTDGVNRGNDESMVEPIFMSTTRTGVLLGEITRKHVYNLIAEGELVSTHIGRRRVVTLDSIRAYAERRLAAAKAASAGT